MHFLVYKITNLINSKYYIGVHKTKNPEDGYMGSGKLITRAVGKYGVENFKKEILFDYNTAEEMFDKEKELVTEKVVKDRNCYNVKLGGTANFYFINNNGLNHSAGQHLIHNNKLKTDPLYRQQWIEKTNPSRVEAGKKRRGRPGSTKGHLWITNTLTKKHVHVTPAEAEILTQTENWVRGLKNIKPHPCGFYTFFLVDEGTELTKTLHEWNEYGLSKDVVFKIRGRNDCHHVYTVQSGPKKGLRVKFRKVVRVDGTEHLPDTVIDPHRRIPYYEKYNFGDIQKDHNLGMSWRELRGKYGISTDCLAKATKCGLFVSRSSNKQKVCPISQRDRHESAKLG